VETIVKARYEQQEKASVVGEDLAVGSGGVCRDDGVVCCVSIIQQHRNGIAPRGNN